MLTPKELKEYESWGVSPKSQDHGTFDEIRQNLKQLWPTHWRLEGNHLIGQTEMGEFVQTIPTDYVLEGTDDSGRPIFRKIDISSK